MSVSTIMLVDDHPVVREGYRRLIETRRAIRVVAEADTAAEAYRFYRETGPDLVIMDLSLPGPGGLEALRRIRQWDSKAKVLVFTMHSESAYAMKAFEAGAAGFVTKSSEPEVLLKAIDAVLAGRRAVSPDVSGQLADERIEGTPHPLSDLSPRETEILRMIALGMTDEAIADNLFLSLKTVQNNHYRIRAKLHLQTDAQLTRIAVKTGLVAFDIG